MPYVANENGNHITDENGNKLEYEKIDFVYVHREAIHVNSDGHVDTEDRNIKVKDATSGSHAASKNQLDNLNTQITSVINNLQSQFNTMIQQAVNNLKSEITTQIQTSMKTHEAKILTQMLNFRNEQIKNCIQRKYLKIPRTINTWLKLFDKSDVGDGVYDLNNVIVLNVWIKRWDRYHNGKSALLETDFNNSIEFFYNNEMTAAYTYFSTVPDRWDMSCFIE